MEKEKIGNLRRKLEKRIRKVFVIPYAHCDFNYTHSRAWHEERYALIFNETLDLMNRNKNYKWYFDNQNEELLPFTERYPKKMDELRKRIKEGRIGVVGVITGGQYTFFGGETFIRNMQYGRRYFEKEFPGADLTVMTANDTVVGCSQLPQLIRKAGFKYFRFTHPGSSTEVCDAKRMPREFLWEGMDGTKLLTSRGSCGGPFILGSSEDKDNYDHTFFIMWRENLFPNDYKKDWDKAFHLLGQELEYLSKEKFNVSGLIFYPQGCDDSLPLRADGLWGVSGRNPSGNKPLDRLIDIPGLIMEWNKREKMSMEFGIPLDYFKELEKYIKKLPVWKGIIDPVGYLLVAEAHCRELLADRNEECLLKAEKFSSLANLSGLQYPEKRLLNLWHEILSTAGHASGSAFAGDYDKLLWKKENALKKADDISMEAMGFITQKIKVKHGEAVPIVIFNGLSWNRKDIVQVKINFVKADNPVRNLVVKDCKGKVVPHQIVRYQPYENDAFSEIDLIFVADVPSLGYATYYVRPCPEEVKGKEQVTETVPLKIENEYYRIAIKEGCISSIYDKELKRKLLKETNKTLINNIIFYEDTCSWWEAVPARKKLEGASHGLRMLETKLVEKGPVRIRLLTTGIIGGAEVEQETIIYNNLRRIDFATRINSKKGNGIFWVRFPFTFSGTLTVDVPFGIEERDLSKEPYVGYSRPEGTEGTFYGTHWINYGAKDENYGVTIINSSPAKNRFRIYPEKKILQHALLRVGDLPEYGWKSWCSKLNEGRGQQIFSYSLFPHHGNCLQAGTHQRALEFQNPLTAIIPWGEYSNELPEKKSFVKINRSNVMLSCLQLEGKSLVARLYDKYGLETQAEVVFPSTVKDIKEIDFNGRPVVSKRKITVAGDKLSLSINPWEIVTLRIKLKEGC